MFRHHGSVSTAVVNPAPSYRSVLALPGVLRLVVLTTLARVPQAAAGVVMTLHVARTLGAGYAVAGAVVAAMTIGMTLGGPWRGRAVDRAGLRRALVPSLAASVVAWGSAPFLGPVGLVVAGLLGGVLMLPVFTVARQSLAVLVPESGRRVAFSVDSIGTEISFMVGPALGVLVATQVSTRWALVMVGAMTVASGVAFFVMNPPTRSEVPQDGPAVALSRRDWFTPGLTVVFGVSSAAALVLASTDVSAVAVLDGIGRVDMAGLVIVVWSLGSVLGALVYGRLNRQVSPLTLLLLLGLLTAPAALAGSVPTLAVALFVAGAFCAPTITATTEAVSRLVPERARGEAMGWHGSSMTIGMAVGSPVAGVVIDGAGANDGFLAAGIAGVGIALAGLATQAVRRWNRRALTAGVALPAAEACGTRRAEGVGVGPVDEPAGDPGVLRGRRPIRGGPGR